jgi:hypothetical protein
MSTALAKLVDEQSLIEFAKRDEFLEVINMDPPAAIVKDHPMQTGVKYIPIDKIEMMLTKVFQQWHVEIKREGQLLNSIHMVIRLHYRDPMTKEWQYQDGAGAVPIQVDKGKNASDLAAIKSDAIMKALPAAESYAVKDAAEKIGKLFGRDLNRKDAPRFTATYGTEDFKQQQEAQKKAVREKLHASNQDQPNERPAIVAGHETGKDNGQEVQAGQATE